MSLEVFDIVNENDEVIGAEVRPVVHRLGLRHRAVHVLVFNDLGLVFLQKRSMSKDSAPGKWDSSASGHLDQGESYDACAVRELREEIGLVASEPLQRLFKLSACDDTGAEFVWIYRCRHNGPFVLHPEEIASGQWFSPDQVTTLIKQAGDDFAHSFRLVWQRWLDHPPADAPWTGPTTAPTTPA